MYMARGQRDCTDAQDDWLLGQRTGTASAAASLDLHALTRPTGSEIGFGSVKTDTIGETMRSSCGRDTHPHCLLERGTEHVGVRNRRRPYPRCRDDAGDHSPEARPRRHLLQNMPRMNVTNTGAWKNENSVCRYSLMLLY